MQRISQKSCQSAYEVTGLLLFDHSPVHHQNLEAQAHHLFHCYPDNKETDIFSTFFHLLHPPPPWCIEYWKCLEKRMPSFLSI